MKRTGVAITFFAFFTASKVGKTGLTVTVDVYRKGSGTAIVTAGSATAIGGGLYYYDLASGSTGNADDYIAIFKTSDTSVDFQHVPSLQANVGLSGTPLPNATSGGVGGLALADDLVEVGDDAAHASSAIDDVAGDLIGIATDAAEANTQATSAATNALTAATHATMMVADYMRRTDDVMGLTAAVIGAIWSYASRTLTSGPLIADDGQQFNARVVVIGDTYDADGRPFIVSIATGASWPADLSLYTWVLNATKDPANEEDGSASITGTVEIINATGSNRSVRVNLSAATTAGMAPGIYQHAVRGTLISDTNVHWSIETGTIEAKATPSNA